MKKILVIGTIVALVLITFGVVGYAYAQTQTPQSTDEETSWGCGGNGYFGSGMMGGQRNDNGQPGRGMMGGQRSGSGGVGCDMMDGEEDSGEYGPLHEYMIKAYAEALGLTPEELVTRHNAGDTPWEIAQEKDLTAEQFRELMVDARTKALNQAVADGVITQAQADFMLQHMNNMMGNNFDAMPGFGGGPGYGPNGCPHGGQWNNQPTATP